MIQFIDLTDTDSSDKRFAFYNRTQNKFVNFNKNTIWDSLYNFKNDFDVAFSKADAPHTEYFDILNRFTCTIPDNFFEAKK